MELKNIVNEGYDKFCRACGNKNEAGDKFCRACGNKNEQKVQDKSVESNKTEGAAKDNLTTNKSEKKKESLEDQKKSAIDDFLKTLKSQEILVGEFSKDQKDKLIEETTREIEEAIDSDFVDLAMAKGMKKALEMMKAKKIENLTKQIKET
ncbi:MAG: zinc ribbon domain-containing protein [Candidatus Paceibacterota bacterium]|jgi:hypothetical protein